MAETIRFAEELISKAAFELQGHQIGGLPYSVIIVDFPEPGMGPRLHRHPYAELFITMGGEALLTVGDERLTVRAGEMIIAPANTPHKFVSTGDGPLRQIDIHASDRFSTEWLEEDGDGESARG
jgi:mannose-6-phosphate isomerase-like protein (cupin superfamily)